MLNKPIKLIVTTIFISVLLISCAEDEKIQTKLVNTKDSVIKPETKIPQSTNTTDYNAGIDYDILQLPYATDNTEKVVVYEFFGYTCPHCYHFEPFLNKWLETKPDYVELVRVPLNFHPSWAVFQRAYLTAQVMGVADQAHSKLFEVLHEDHKRFNSIDELAQWYADVVGVNKDEFLSTANSFILDSKLSKADNMGLKMQITGTPTLVINGKYRPSTKIPDKNKVMGIMNFLIEKEAKEMGLIK